MGEIVLRKATQFMRDNTSGDLVKSGNVTPSGGLVYRMQSGLVYRLSVKEAAILARYVYKPRYVSAGRSALSQDQGDSL
ncbi:hypothetical protein LJR164_001585 [Phenylobacterium sp. LjRoot164]|uniref:hypothetical protein n=1 Tax=unclassified Phenylobacterium TaxID=2640670 RepID=UPI003ECE0962